ncbi:vitamin K epoxide reductase family protein [Streptomyces sp. NPDC048710]|uniref:vitamin K epoxide reductase family protein n=1 Tax=unclassified Streptomyces TaxID=2593676 RepID=UPI003718E2C4
MRPPRPARPGRRIGWLLTLTGLIGWLASFELSVDDWRLLKNPAYQPPCNISPIISCGNVMASPEGSVFGFPNMLLGLGAFAAVAVLGLAVLTGARLHRALWLTLNAGAVAGVLFVHWLIYQSLFGLGRICPYCAVVWAVTIALFWYTTLRNVRHGLLPVPASGRSCVALVLETHWMLLAAWYGVIAVLVLTRFWPYWSSLP